ncbi:MAG: acyltransferase family protein [Phycisphaerales bacterium]|jgi:peptidoglycan/LPS O-acetylase OafA/YrhL
MPDARRLYFLDNLRIALTVLVIAHHVGQAYGPTGGAWPIQETARAAILGPFFTVNRSFFMSLFFMISGYLMVASYDRSGTGPFLKGRLLRLGIPLLAFFFLVIPLQQYLCHCRIGDLDGMSFGQYYGSRYFAPVNPEANFQHLWYVEHLLIFSLCYAVLRAVWKRPSQGNPAEAKPLKHTAILVFALALAVASAVVRNWYPIDRWIGFLGFIQVAFADVPRDLSFFVLGAVAYRRQWFLGLSNEMGRTWLGIGLAAAVLWYAYALARMAGVPRINPEVMGVAYPIWESLLCCGMCIGLLFLFREKLNIQSRWGKWMAESQYAAYVFHVPVVVLIQFALVSAALSPFTKFALVTAASVPLTFLLSAAIRTPALVRKVL